MNLQHPEGGADGLTAQGLATAKFAVGQSVPRVEDPMLLRGLGDYTDDVSLPGQAYMAMVRSSVAHGKIRVIDTEAARKMPGVLAIYRSTDLKGYGTLKCIVGLPNRDGTPLRKPRREALAVDKVRYVGDPVACVIAETLAQAKDAAEAVTVDIEPLPIVATAEQGAREGAAQIYDDVPGNVALDFHHGDTAAVDAAFAQAAHVTRLKMTNSRLVVNCMEPLSSHQVRLRVTRRVPQVRPSTSYFSLCPALDPHQRHRQDYHRRPASRECHFPMATDGVQLEAKHAVQSRVDSFDGRPPFIRLLPFSEWAAVIGVKMRRSFAKGTRTIRPNFRPPSARVSHTRFDPGTRIVVRRRAPILQPLVLSRIPTKAIPRTRRPPALEGRLASISPSRRRGPRRGGPGRAPSACPAPPFHISRLSVAGLSRGRHRVTVVLRNESYPLSAASSSAPSAISLWFFVEVLRPAAWEVRHVVFRGLAHHERQRQLVDEGPPNRVHLVPEPLHHLLPGASPVRPFPHKCLYPQVRVHIPSSVALLPPLLVLHRFPERMRLLSPRPPASHQGRGRATFNFVLTAHGTSNQLHPGCSRNNAKTTQVALSEAPLAPNRGGRTRTGSRSSPLRRSPGESEAAERWSVAKMIAITAFQHGSAPERRHAPLPRSFSSFKTSPSSGRTSRTSRNRSKSLAALTSFQLNSERCGMMAT